MPARRKRGQFRGKRRVKAKVAIPPCNPDQQLTHHARDTAVPSPGGSSEPTLAAPAPRKPAPGLTKRGTALPPGTDPLPLRGSAAAPLTSATGLPPPSSSSPRRPSATPQGAQSRGPPPHGRPKRPPSNGCPLTVAPQRSLPNGCSRARRP